MNFRTTVVIIFSFIIGIFIAYNFSFFSGMSPFLGKIFFAIIGGMLIWTLILIFREKNKKLRLIQLIILLSTIGIGIYKAKTEFDSSSSENPRRYYQTDTELGN